MQRRHVPASQAGLLADIDSSLQARKPCDAVTNVTTLVSRYHRSLRLLAAAMDVLSSLHHDYVFTAP